MYRCIGVSVYRCIGVSVRARCIGVSAYRCEERLEDPNPERYGLLALFLYAFRFVVFL